ncbi:MAG: gliding motility-associated C-terminal domain-containing protein [Bacteroidota bacterium]
MPKLLFIVIFLPLFGFSQNLVPNYSFESFNSVLPCGWIQNDFTFDTTLTNWYKPTQATPDIYSLLVDESCPAHCFFSGDAFQDTRGQQAPRTGNVMIAVVTYGVSCNNVSNQWKEYASVKLEESLQIGESYYAEMYVSHADSCAFFTNYMGFYFTQDSFNFPLDCDPLIVEPQVVETNVIYESEQWQKISGTFVATEEFEYLTIGNFAVIPQLEIDFNSSTRWNRGYYFLDDITVRKACQNTYDTLNVCLGDEIVLSSEINEFVGWAESTSPTEIFSTEEILQIIPTQNTTYIGYTVCDTALIHVQINPTASFTLGNDTSLCQGQTLTLNAPSTADNFSWSDGSSLENFNIVEDGVYWIEMEDECGMFTDSISVNYLPSISIDLGEDQNLCSGDSIILDAFSPFANYEWQDNSTEPTFLVTSEGSYSVSVEDHCSNDSDEIEINYYPEIIIDLPDDVLLCNSDSLFFNLAISDATYLWQDGSTDQNYLVTEEGLYSVEVTQNGCLKSDSVYVEEDACEIILAMPNVFSPNGDGYNDVFRPFDINAFTEGSMYIYNRWGGQVYTTLSLALGWDGSCEAHGCSSGTYFWVIDYLDINGNRLSLSGDLLLLRE